MPGSLPPGWQLAVDAMNRPFYYNYFTQQTSWTPPSATSIPSPIPPSAMYSVPAPPAAPPVSAPVMPSPPTPSPVDTCMFSAHYLKIYYCYICFSLSLKVYFCSPSHTNILFYLYHD